MYKCFFLTNVRSFKRKKQDFFVKITSFSFLMCVAKLFLFMSQYILIISILKLDLIDFVKDDVMNVSEIFTFEISNFVIELRYFMIQSIMMWKRNKIRINKKNLDNAKLSCKWKKKMMCVTRFSKSWKMWRSFMKMIVVRSL